ncbi:MAG: hypothetical protein B9S33_12960 [Pedosphaera sp. Tous-C6FEB]|nr:MAG: hypothetical protein B9S33_12960 [Pedosphaera sp. Tous-C6FEB]
MSSNSLLVVVLVAVGTLGLLIWLVAAAMRASNRGSSDSSTHPTELGGSTNHSHESSDSGGSDSGGGDSGGGGGDGGGGGGDGGGGD